MGYWDAEAPTYFYILPTDSSEVVILTHPATLYSQEDSQYLFMLEAESTPGP
jgi:hypothetical protein